jgi:hypothetical protein
VFRPCTTATTAVPAGQLSCNGKPQRPQWRRVGELSERRSRPCTTGSTIPAAPTGKLKGGCRVRPCREDCGWRRRDPLRTQDFRNGFQHSCDLLALGLRRAPVLGVQLGQRVARREPGEVCHHEGRVGSINGYRAVVRVGVCMPLGPAAAHPCAPPLNATGLGFQTARQRQLGLGFMVYLCGKCSHPYPETIVLMCSYCEVVRIVAAQAQQASIPRRTTRAAPARRARHQSHSSPPAPPTLLNSACRLSNRKAT